MVVDTIYLGHRVKKADFLKKRKLMVKMGGKDVADALRRMLRDIYVDLKSQRKVGVGRLSCRRPSYIRYHACLSSYAKLAKTNDAISRK